MADRILEITDLLMGAAHADRELRPEEDAAVRKVLGELLGEPDLPADVEARVNAFIATAFDLEQTAKTFADDPASEKKKLLELVASVRDADDEIDLDEDAYLRNLAKAIGVPEAELADLVVDYEVEELRERARSLRTALPPPVPEAKT
jgi:uncharacterized tellurite resistance protein B-like protein